MLLHSLAALTNRVAKAQSFGPAIQNLGQPRTDTPSSVPVPAVAAAATTLSAAPGEPLNGHQMALIAFSQFLEGEIAEPAGRPARMAAMTAGPTSHVETAKKRIQLFLAQQKAKTSGGLNVGTFAW